MRLRNGGNGRRQVRIEPQVGKRYRIGRFVFEVVSTNPDEPQGDRMWLVDLEAWGRYIKTLPAEPITPGARVLSPKQDKTPCAERIDANTGGFLFD